MEDLSALAARIAANAGALRGCLILSKDGLVLGAHPSEAEAALKPAWLRFASLGESDKGFVEFGDELWAYVRRGPYGAFAVAEVSVRPGLLIDQLEQALLGVEEARSKRESLRIPDAPSAPSGKPRTNLHKEPRPAPERAPAEQRNFTPGGTAASPPPPSTPSPSSPSGGAAAAPRPEPAQPRLEPAQPGARPGEAEGPGSPPPPEAPADVRPTATDQDAGEDEGPEEGGEVDRVLLAQEFSRLLQEPGLDDEA